MFNINLHSITETVQPLLHLEQKHVVFVKIFFQTASFPLIFFSKTHETFNVAKIAFAAKKYENSFSSGKQKYNFCQRVKLICIYLFLAFCEDRQCSSSFYSVFGFFFCADGGCGGKKQISISNHFLPRPHHWHHFRYN